MKASVLLLFAIKLCLVASLRASAGARAIRPAGIGGNSFQGMQKGSANLAPSLSNQDEQSSEGVSEITSPDS